MHKQISHKKQITSGVYILRKGRSDVHFVNFDRNFRESRLKLYPNPQPAVLQLTN